MGISLPSQSLVIWQAAANGSTVLNRRHKHKAEQRGPFSGPEGAERQGEGGRPV